MNHPRNSEWFEHHRWEVFDFTKCVETCIVEDHMKHILIKAPVKSGKKDITECIAVVMSTHKVKYITSLNRKDVKSQKDELQLYDIATFVTDSEQACNNAIRDILKDLEHNHPVIIVFDESDHGSGKNQKLSLVFNQFREDNRVVKMYVSASAHETESSILADRHDYVCVKFIPPLSYRGAEWFIENNLVYDPEPFFEKDGEDIVITEHAKEVILDSITSDRHIGVVRVSSKIKVSSFKNKQIRNDAEKQLTKVDPDEKEWIIIPVDESSPFEWDDEVKQCGLINLRKNVLIIIAQTCTRGTDLRGWHHKLAFWHDARKKQKSNLNTLIQALLRPCHYAGMADGYNRDGEPIRMYVDRGVLEAVADDDVSVYINSGGKAPARMRSKKSKREYAISNTSFASQDEAKQWARMNNHKRPTNMNIITGTNTFRYRTIRNILTESETRESTDLGYGVETATRIMPVFDDGNGDIRFIVIYRTGTQTDPIINTTKSSMYETY